MANISWKCHEKSEVRELGSYPKFRGNKEPWEKEDWSVGMENVGGSIEKYGVSANGFLQSSEGMPEEDVARSTPRLFL